jgi:hypothetical protein
MTDPPTLLAVLLAARRTGDRALESAARQLLDERHDIEVRLRERRWRRQQGATP